MRASNEADHDDVCDIRNASWRVHIGDEDAPIALTRYLTYHRQIIAWIEAMPSSLAGQYFVELNIQHTAMTYRMRQILEDEGYEPR